MAIKDGYGSPSMRQFNEFMDLKKKLCTKKGIDYNFRVAREEFQNLNKYQCLNEIRRLKKELEK